jgi:hypothetical protein
MQTSGNTGAFIPKEQYGAKAPKKAKKKPVKMAVNKKKGK